MVGNGSPDGVDVVAGQDVTEIAVELAASVRGFAQALRIEPYGLKAGYPADIVFLAAGNALEALRLQPVERIVVRNGRLVSRRRQDVQMHNPA